MRFQNLASVVLAALLAGCTTLLPGSLQGSEHRVPVTSTAPAMRGQTAHLYVREVMPAGSGRKPAVLFVHGAGTPAEVSFDSRVEDYSWMRQVARAGFDVFSASLAGYGGSTRPAPMNDPCNIVKTQQARYVPAPCAPG